MPKKIELIDVLKELHNISGYRICIYDTQLQEIAAYPACLSGFCTLVQQNPDAHKLCVKNDALAFETVRTKGSVHIYQCQFGLFEAVAPLYYCGVLSGYLMMGQILDNIEKNHDQVMEKASPYVEDKQLLSQEIRQICESSNDKILSCVAIMNICADYISLSNRLNPTDKNLAQRLKKYIDDNYASKVTIDTLSSHFFYSKQTIMSVFKKAFGKTINQYLHETRLQHSARLLASTTDSIHLVSQQCGFSDQNYFTKVFVKEYGTTPSQYRIECWKTT